MKGKKKLLIMFMISICICIGVVDNVPFFNNCVTVEAASVKINKKKATMYIGNTLKLKVKGTKRKVKWKTSSKKIATVSSKGVVKAKKAGKVTIRAVVNKKKYKCKIIVKKAPKTKISLSAKSLSLYKGDTLRLTANTENYNGSITWSSSNPNVATVNNGVVTANSKGSTIITATVGSTQATCVVTVLEHTITYIADRSVEYVPKKTVYRVFFSLMYEDGKTRTSSDGYASISITNTNGEMVYNKSVPFSQNNFGNWTNVIYGTRYLCCIEIKKEDITLGQVDSGELSLGVTLNDGTPFNPRTYTVENLPVKPIEVTFTCVDGQTVSYDSPSNYVKFTDVTYSINKNTMTIKFKATRMGATYSYVFADYKIVSGDTVVESGPVTGSTSLSDLEEGESAQYSISVPIENGGIYELKFIES